MNFKNMSIATRLTLTLSMIVALLLASALSAAWQLRALHTASNEISDNWLPSVELVNKMNTAASDLRLGEFQHVANTDDAAMAAIEKEMNEVVAAFEKSRAAYVPLISSPEEQALYSNFDAEWKKYMAVHEQTLQASRINDNEQARKLLETEGKQLFAAASAKLDQLVDLNHNGATQATADANAAYQQALTTLAIASAVAVALAAFAGFRLIRSITVPMREAVEAADRVAAGDLTGHIVNERGDETGRLLQALQRMQDSLSDTVGSVRSNAESVATASAQIAQGNTDLSQRTEEQASALQQTAATMEELGTTVRHNAENAQQASRLATDASTVASMGGDVVGRVVDTMKSINTSSRKISDIISVIDGIAFQTNILALNAAVEAARAGEQGRGFAVVASEVRSLAQRSAEAAKEIKTLITTSVEQVEHGTTLVDQAGATMTDIVRAIDGVRAVVTEISEASAEQSSGVSQVGQAVSQMDQATQQNAALVEESAAAAESLRGQAQQLVASVSAFKLSGGHGSGAGHAVAFSSPAPAPAPAKAQAAYTRAKAAPVAAAPRSVPAAPKAAPVRAAAASSAPALVTAGATSAEWESF
jgi:methyl-accepting chemotaxis protein